MHTVELMYYLLIFIGIILISVNINVNQEIVNKLYDFVTKIFFWACVIVLISFSIYCIKIKFL